MILGLLAFHLVLTLNHGGLLGVDGGAYLLNVNAVLGYEPTGAGFPRPPLAPGWLLVPFTSLLGIDVGYKVWSAVASILPAVPVYLMARRIGGAPGPLLSWAAFAPMFAAGLLLLDLLHAEMIVTGALPLIGFALLGMVWWAMAELAGQWSLPKAGVLAACLGLIPWVNQTTAGLAIVTIPVYLSALMWFHRSYKDAGPAAGTSTSTLLRMAPPLFIGGAIALGALPWYLKVLPVSGVLDYPGPFIYLTHWGDSSWFQFLLAWPLGLYLIRKGGEPWLRSLGVLTCLLGTLLIFLSTDETIINVFYRSRYLLALPFYIGITWCVFVKWLPSLPERLLKPAVGLSVAVAAVLAVGYVSQFNRQAEYSRMVSRDTETAIALIPDDGRAVVSNSFTLALWIAALHKTPAPHTWTWEPPPTWTETDREVRCVLGWRSGCDVAASVQRLNAGYVLIESRFPYYNARAPGVWLAPNVAEPWADLPEVPWLSLMYERGTTHLWRIVDGTTKAQ